MPPSCPSCRDPHPAAITRAPSGGPSPSPTPGCCPQLGPIRQGIVSGGQGARETSPPSQGRPPHRNQQQERLSPWRPSSGPSAAGSLQVQAPTSLGLGKLLLERAPRRARPAPTTAPARQRRGQLPLARSRPPPAARRRGAESTTPTPPRTPGPADAAGGRAQWPTLSPAGSLRPMGCRRRGFFPEGSLSADMRAPSAKMVTPFSGPYGTYRLCAWLKRSIHFQT